MEVFYWNATTGVRASAQPREEFAVHLCPLPEEGFPPPRLSMRDADRRYIEWFDAFDVVKLVTGRRPRFDVRELCGKDPVVIVAYADALRSPCRSLPQGETSMWTRLRRQRTARIAYRLRPAREADA